MTAIIGLRRLGLILIATLVAGMTILAATSYLISANTVRRQAIQEIRTVTGLDVNLGDRATVSLFPTGAISFNEVMLGHAAQPALTAGRLTARLRFFPLLLGRVEIADVSLEQPTITIEVRPDGKSNWSGFIETLAKSRKSNGSQIVTTLFSEMRIKKGTVVLRNQARHIDETFNDVEFSLAWPSISKGLGATGHFMWHGESMDAALTLADFQAGLTDAQSRLKLHVAGQPLTAAFEGAISINPTLKLEGVLAAETNSLRNALTWVGGKAPPGGGFGHFAIKATTKIIGDMISLTGVNIELDGNTAEGVLTFVNDDRRTLQGTLATDTLNLSTYISTVDLLTGNRKAWNNTQIETDNLKGMDVDLRLSAANVIVSNARMGRTAIGANLRGGHLAITIGEAQAYDGVIQGSLNIANSGQEIAVKSQLRFTGVNLQTCLSQLFGIRQLEGKGNIALNIEGKGQSVLAVARTLDGTASLTGEKGALSGLDIEKLLRRLEKRPLSGGGDFRNGSTAYDKIVVNLKIADGTIVVDDVKIDGTAVKLSMAGSASIPARSLDLKGSAALLSASTPDTIPFELPFVVQGSWDDPIMLPDAEVLIRHSGAAAPLLRALGNRDASDKVRSVIEKFTGTSNSTPAAERP